MTNRRTRCVRTLTPLALLHSRSVGHAHEIAGKVQLALDLDLVTYTKTSIEPDVPGAAEIEVTDTNIGTLASSGVSVGYGFTDSVVLGASVAVAHENQSQDGEDDVSLTQLTLAPFVQLVFPGENVRSATPSAHRARRQVRSRSTATRTCLPSRSGCRSARGCERARWASCSRATSTSFISLALKRRSGELPRRRFVQGRT